MMTNNLIQKINWLVNALFALGWLLFFATMARNLSLAYSFPTPIFQIITGTVQKIGPFPIYRWEVALIYTIFFYYAYRQYFYHNISLAKRITLLLVSAILLVGSLYWFDNLYYRNLLWHIRY